MYLKKKKHQFSLNLNHLPHYLFPLSIKYLLFLISAYFIYLGKVLVQNKYLRLLTNLLNAKMFDKQKKQKKNQVYKHKRIYNLIIYNIYIICNILKRIIFFVSELKY